VEEPIISVIIPTYNEEENIGPFLNDLSEVIDNEFELILVDGDSTDRTVQTARETGIEQLKIFEQDFRKGLGSAIKKGLSEASGEIVVQIDADFSHPTEKIQCLVERISEGYDVAIGSRYVEEGERKDPLHRRLPPLIGSYLYRYMIGSTVKDVTSGFKAYNREAVEFLLEQDLPDGFHFQAASLMSLMDRKTVEVPIEFGPRRAGKPKYGFKDLVDNVLLLLRLFLERLFSSSYSLFLQRS